MQIELVAPNRARLPITWFQRAPENQGPARAIVFDINFLCSNQSPGSRAANSSKPGFEEPATRTRIRAPVRANNFSSLTRRACGLIHTINTFILVGDGWMSPMFLHYLKIATRFSIKKIILFFIDS